MNREQAVAWAVKLAKELDARCAGVDRLDRYRIGYPDAPAALKEIRQETEYRSLLRQAVTNWPELIIGSRLDRLEITGFDFGSKTDNDRIWSTYQRNALDGDSGILHDAVLTDGRAFAIVWKGDDGKSEIVAEHATTCIVGYSMTNSRKRIAALRRWEEDGQWFGTLYTATEIWKFQSKTVDLKPQEAGDWIDRENLPADEEFPLPNPLEVVPVVEFRVGRTMGRYRISADPLGQATKVNHQFGSAQGEFEGVLPVIDRVNTVIFNGLLACAFAGFPVRALIGDPIIWEEDSSQEDGLKRDSNGDAVPRASFKPAVNRFFQIENPDGKLQQLPAADLNQFIDFAGEQVRYLSAITRTPAHYMLGEMVNLAADAIRAAEAALISRITGRLWLDLGEPWEEVMRIADRVDGNDIEDTDSAATQWKDPENRSHAEQADAALKLQGILPWQALAERILSATPEEVARWETMRQAEGLIGTMAAAATELNGPAPMNGAPPALPQPPGEPVGVDRG